MTNQMAVYQENSMSIESMGNVFVKSGFFADTRDQAQAIVKILAGKELGISPIASMTGVYIVKGKPSMGANLIAACIKNSGRYNYKVITLNEKECEIDFYERFDVGEKMTKSGTSKFTIEDAKKAGTQNIDKYPRNMLFARAMSNGAKWYCASIFSGGIYTPDELGASVQYDESGDINKVEVIDAPQPKPASEPLDFFGLQVPDISLETAMLEKNSQGILYSELPKEKLQHMARKMADILHTGKVGDAEINDEQRAEYMFKLSCIKAIVNAL